MKTIEKAVFIHFDTVIIMGAGVLAVQYSEEKG